MRFNKCDFGRGDVEIGFRIDVVKMKRVDSDSTLFDKISVVDDTEMRVDSAYGG
jgi:hypothetical protein